jgi:type I restriction-modification system DNA methylase subunit
VRKRADYVLSYKPGIRLAVIEAKDNNHPVGAGMQQAIAYAESLDVPFVYSSNGDAFVEHDRTRAGGELEREIPLDAYPSPEELWRRYSAWKDIESPEQQAVVTQEYYRDAGGKRPRYFPSIPERLRWKNWAADPEGVTGEALLDFVNDDLFKTLKNLSLDADATGCGAVVRSVFEDAINYMKSGHLMRQVINRINEIDFNNSKDRHLFGDIYEQILRDLQSAGNAGEFYTPRAVTQFMVEMVDPQLDEHVLDPACGTGGFLTGALEHMRRQERTKEDREKWQKNIVGVEKKALPHLLSVTNMMLHGVEVPTNVRHRNMLARSLAGYTSQDRVDVILTNPPFGGMEEDGVEKASAPTRRRRRPTCSSSSSCTCSGTVAARHWCCPTARSSARALRRASRRSF